MAFCNRLIIANRSKERAFIAGLNNWNELRPTSLARYIAISACLSNVALSTPSSGKTAAPIEAVIATTCSLIASGILTCCNTCSAKLSSVSTRFTSHNRTNSSPPKRARVSPSGRIDKIRSATCCNKLSPASCPKLSLTSLKRSKSINITANRSWFRLALLRAIESRSWNKRRLGKPVSSS